MEDNRILGVSWPLFFVLAAIMCVAVYLEVLPIGLIGAFLLMLVVGEFLNFAGNRIPIINTYFGGELL